jgi:hypothetical protein
LIEIKSKEWTLILHHNPDPDAIVSAWQLKTFGEAEFPGVSKAGFNFWSGGPEPIPEGEKFIPVDIGGGRFDHHPPKNKPRDCAATLVAKELGVEKDPSLQPILEYVKKHDLQGTRTPLDFADFVRCLNQRYLENPDKVLEIAFEILDGLYLFYSSNQKENQEDRDKLAKLIDKWLKSKDKFIAQQIVRFNRGISNGNREALDLALIFLALQRKKPDTAKATIKELLEAKYLAQVQFFEKAGKELKKAKVTPIIRENWIFNVVTIKSDNPEMAKLARHKRYGYNAAVVIQQNSNGRTMVFTNLRFRLARDLENIVAAIRLEEQLQRKTNSQRLTISFRRLTQPGHVRHTENWYYQKEPNPGGGKLLNGSLTAPDIEPTKIPLDLIQEIVVTILKLGKYFKWKTWVAKRLSHHKLSQRKKA